MVAALVVCAISFSVTSSESVSTGFWGNDAVHLSYPLCSSFIIKKYNNDMELLHMWYMHEYGSYAEKYTPLGYLSSLWCMNYCIGDPEVWHEDYLDRFETVLAGAYKYRAATVTGNGTQLYEYNVDSYSWDNKTLSVQYSANYDITYSCYTDSHVSTTGSTQIYGYYVDIIGADHPCVHMAITDKSDGSLVHMGMIEDSELSPEYRYGSRDYYMIEEAQFIDKELWNIRDTGEKINYTCTTTKSSEVQMPDFFDPEKHDVTLYFRMLTDYRYNGHYIDEKNFYNPVLLSTDGFGTPAENTTASEPPVTTEPEPSETTVTSQPDPTPPPTEPEYPTGDANKDLFVNLDDVSLMLKHIAGWENLTIDISLADTDADSKVTLPDVTWVLKKIAGWDV